MRNRKLKHYQRSLFKLGAYAKLLGYTVKYAEEDVGSTIVFLRKVIMIERGMSESVTLAEFLHELGHLRDLKVTGEVDYARIDKAYRKFHGGKAKPKHKKEVIGCEKRAWDYGRAIAKEFGIPLGKWYGDNESFCLQSYIDN